MAEPAAGAWAPMSIAPTDRPVDLLAERWIVGHDRMRTETFAGCRWSPGGSVRHPVPHWRRLPRGFTAIGWREAALDRG